MNTTRRPFAAALVFVCSSFVMFATWAPDATAQSAPPARSDVDDPARAAAESARAELSRVRELNAIPGLAAAVVSDEGVVWADAVGVADLEGGVAATPSTRFRVGSVSKLFTATLAARLARRGRLDLDADVRKYVAAFPDKGATITLRQLLGHMGGIRHYAPKDFDRNQPGGPIDVRSYPDTSSMLAIFADDPLVAKPGEKTSYSTFGYTLASAAIEGACGEGRKESFAEIMRDELLRPLGLDDGIVVDDLRAIVPHRAAPYDLAGAGEAAPPKTVVRAWPMNSAYKIAGGGYLASAEALAKFGGAVFDSKLLDRETLDLLFREQTTSDGKPTGVGLGWRLGRDADGRRFVHHSGSQLGCRAVLVVYPEERLSIAVLSNLTNVPENVLPVGQGLAALFMPAK